MTAPEGFAAAITRADVEDFLYGEAALLDSWALDEWLGLLTEDATYRVPSNATPETAPGEALFLIADDIDRLRARVKRLQSDQAHAEFPRSRTRRMIANVRITGRNRDRLEVEANVTVHRFRRGGRAGSYIGRYRYTLVATPQGLRIAARTVVLDAEELGPLGAVSFIL